MVKGAIWVSNMLHVSSTEFRLQSPVEKHSACLIKISTGSRGPRSEVRSRETSVSDETTNLINPEPSTSLTDLCLICRDNIMRCILYIEHTIGHIDKPDQKRLNRIRKSLCGGLSTA